MSPAWLHGVGGLDSMWWAFASLQYDVWYFPHTTRADPFFCCSYKRHLNSFVISFSARVWLMEKKPSSQSFPVRFANEHTNLISNETFIIFLEQFAHHKSFLNGCAGVEPVGAEPPQPLPKILRAIRMVAPFVARMGPAFEALAISKNASLPEFSFLTGGEGRWGRWLPAAYHSVISEN